MADQNLKGKEEIVNNVPAKVVPKRTSGRLILLISIIAVFLFLSIYQSYRAYFAPRDSSDNASNQNLTTSTNTPNSATAPGDTSSTNSSKKPSSSKSSGNSAAQPAPESSNTGTATAPDISNIVEYFIDIALHYSGQRDLTTGVERWVKNPFYVGAAPGALDGQLETCLDGFIRDFNNASTAAKLQKNREQADIKIYVVTPAQMTEYGGEDSGWGFNYTYRNSSNEDYKGEIFISTETPADDAVRCYLMRHEMMHAVGFRGHSDRFWEGIMAVPGLDRNTQNLMNDVDTKAIQMLYSIGIPLKANEGDARSYATAHYPN